MADVTVTYLEMDGPQALVPGGHAPDGVTMCREAGPAAAPLAAELYRSVGAAYHWRDRGQWSTAEWSALLSDPAVELWTARRGDDALGYFELKRAADTVEIKYFGIMPDQVGRGLGGWMLTEAVRRSWRPGVARVVVNTCTLDHPAALPNYLARGFRIVRREHQRRELPA